MAGPLDMNLNTRKMHVTNLVHHLRQAATSYESLPITDQEAIDEMCEHNYGMARLLKEAPRYRELLDEEV